MMRALIGAAVIVSAAVGGGAAAGPPALGGRGLLRPEAEIALRAGSSGVVLSVPRLEGDAVAAGEPVVLLDDAEVSNRAALARCDLETAEIGLKKVKDGPREEDLARARALHEESKAGVLLAQRTLDADRKLHVDGLLSDISRQRSERSLEAAKAQAESRRLDLVILEKSPRPDELRLAEVEVERRRALLADRQREAARARVSSTRKDRGFVSRVWVDPGQWVDADKVVAEIVYMDRVRVELDLPAADGLLVKRGTKATIRAARFPEVVLDAQVERVSPVIDPGAGTVRVVVVAANPELRMRPGVEAEVEILP